jgi:hypothetical protein
MFCKTQNQTSKMMFFKHVEDVNTVAKKVLSKYTQMTITLDNGKLGFMVVTFLWVVVTLP